MSFKKLHDKIIQCHLCPRLVKHREKVRIRTIISEEIPWRKPVPGFGDEKAFLLIVGLAPSVEGANRTGRIFTGDESATFLMKNLYQAKFANQPFSHSSFDGLKLKGCYLTAAVKCVPPHHHPTQSEIKNCSPYLDEEIQLLKNLKAVLVLGQIAFSAYRNRLKHLGHDVRHLRFVHGARYPLDGYPDLFVSYHPSPQNTNTGVLTNEKFLSLLKTIRRRFCR